MADPQEKAVRWCVSALLCSQHWLYLWVVLSVALGTTRAFSQEWNQWRGPTRDGQTQGTDWPKTLDSLRLTWRKDAMGASYSSPVTWGDVIFVTEASDEGSEAAESISALTADSGRKIWSRSWSVEFEAPEEALRHGIWPKSTPATDGQVVVFIGITEQLRCLDAHTGELAWSIDFPGTFDTAVPEFGCTTSPLLTQDSVYVHAAGSLFRIDRETGKPVWRAYNLYQFDRRRNLERECYGSPVIAHVGSTEQVIISTVNDSIGVSVDDGKVLWSAAANGTHDESPNTTPVLWGDSVVLPTESSGLPLYRVTQNGTRVEATESWRNKIRSDLSSPVVVDSHLYTHLKAGRLACVDLRSGETRWVSRENFGRYVSFAVRGGRILALTARGELVLLEATPAELTILGRREVGTRTWSHLAVKGDRVYVRDLNFLAVYEWDDREIPTKR